MDYLDFVSTLLYGLGCFVACLSLVRSLSSMAEFIMDETEKFSLFVHNLTRKKNPQHQATTQGLNRTIVRKPYLEFLHVFPCFSLVFLHEFLAARVGKRLPKL